MKRRERLRRRFEQLRKRVSRCACGGDPDMIENGRLIGRYRLECPCCMWHSPRRQTMRAAIRAWNRDMDWLKEGDAE